MIIGAILYPNPFCMSAFYFAGVFAHSSYRDKQKLQNNLKK